MNAKKNEIIDPKSYAKFLEHIKRDIQDSQTESSHVHHQGAYSSLLAYRQDAFR